MDRNDKPTSRVSIALAMIGLVVFMLLLTGADSIVGYLFG